MTGCGKGLPAALAELLPVIGATRVAGDSLKR